jgi:hypothetical protein
MAIPDDLRRVTLNHLPANIHLAPGELRITGETAEAIVEALLVLAQAMQNDLEQVRTRLEPAPPPVQMDEDLQAFLSDLRQMHAS